MGAFVTSRPDRLDALDVEAFEKMLASRAFLTLKTRIADELLRAQTGCETAEDKRVLWRAQGAVKALRTVLGLPEQILKAMAKPA